MAIQGVLTNFCYFIDSRSVLVNYTLLDTETNTPAGGGAFELRAAPRPPELQPPAGFGGVEEIITTPEQQAVIDDVMRLVIDLVGERVIVAREAGVTGQMPIG